MKLRLSQKGFSHALIMPVIAVVAIGSVGAYVLTRSDASTTPVSVCGTGFKQDSNYPVGKNGKVVGYAWLGYRKSDRKVCSVLMMQGSAYSSKKKQMSIAFKTYDSVKSSRNDKLADTVTNTGSFSYYAGPKYTTLHNPIMRTGHTYSDDNYEPYSYPVIASASVTIDGTVYKLILPPSPHF